MMNIFSKKPTPKEALRESKREMTNATREALRESKREMTNATRGIEKEIGALQLEEKKLVAEIKRTAKTGNEGATKILARQLIRLRQQIANLQGSRAQMRGIATHTQAMHAHSSVAVGMKGATKAMAAMNKQMAPAKQAKVIREFQKQSAQMDMTVLDEIGVDVASQLSAAPKGRIAQKRADAAGSSGVDELEKRLEALRNP
ncbi:vacuolar protein sorting-associated protein 2 like protein 3 [Quercus suber]|uniref:Vacuolar protein sorting-associated protein 2 like protein 3 n=1 Tax=Quercus suber TaxID=58331 RepID=A0AAW0M1W7_QUESU